MKLWLIIYAAGQICGFAGPLPYDMSECIVRRDAMRADQAAVLADGIHRETGEPATEEQLAGLRSLSFECELREIRPELGGR